MICQIGEAARSVLDQVIARHEDVHTLAEQMFEQERPGERWSGLSAADHARYFEGAIEVLAHAWLDRREGRLC